MSGTAIAIAYSPEGFAVAVDGRQHQGDKIFSESTQKVFPTQGNGQVLGCALAGIVNVYNPDSMTVPLFDFARVLREAGHSLTAKNYANVLIYLKRFASEVNKALARAKRNGIISEYIDEDGTGTIARAFLAGYYDRRPVVAAVRFFHRQQTLAKEPEAENTSSAQGLVRSRHVPT